MTAIFKREFKAYFSTPIGYAIVAIFTLFSGLFFSAVYMAGQPDMSGVISAMSTVAIIAVPFITMRLLSEDRKQKVDQVLLTAPVSVASIVLGKFWAALALYSLGFAPTLIYQFIISVYAVSSWIPYLYALLGILLLGAVMIAIGMFLSSLTESSVLAAALTYAVFLAVMLLSSYASAAGHEWLEKVGSIISFIDRFNSFTTGIVNLADIIYMVSISFLFLFLSTRSVEQRRWA
ncbi:MAG: ABC transporter permease [Clostridiales bacterium]|nr:ABC transporter permease [Candidatus Equinaster intestinalis]